MCRDSSFSSKECGALDDREAVEAANHHVQNGNIEVTVLSGMEPVRAVGRDGDGMTLFIQTLLSWRARSRSSSTIRIGEEFVSR